MTSFCKCLLMEHDRLPRICAEVLMKLDRKHPAESNNWITRIRKIVAEHDASQLWKDMEASELAKSIERISTSIAQKQREKDLAAASVSTLQPMLQRDFSHDEIASYPTMEIALSRMRIIAQARLRGQPFLRFVSDSSVNRFQPKAQCPICKDEANDDLDHFLTSCVVLHPLRQSDTSDTSKVTMLSVDSKPQAFRLFNFITQALRLRSWSLGE